MTFRIDTARLDAKPKRTPQGGLRVPATLTRVGVFDYYTPDGKKVSELRHPDEVFSATSLASLAYAPVTEGHPGLITPENFREHARGNVGENPHQDGLFVKCEILIQDADTIKRATKQGPDKLVEVSCGYSTDLDWTPGEYEGVRYDCVQRNIVYNHVGLGPKNWGRAGNDVRIHLDSLAASFSNCNSVAIDSELRDLDLSGSTTVPESAPEALATLESMPKEREDASMTPTNVPVEVVEKPTEAPPTQAPNAESPAEAPSQNLEEKVMAAVETVDSASAPVVAPQAKTYTADEVKALFSAFSAAAKVAPSVTMFDASGEPLSTRAIYLQALTALKVAGDMSAKTDDYVQARFDAACESVSNVVGAHAALLTGAVERQDNEDLVSKARAKMLADYAALLNK